MAIVGIIIVPIEPVLWAEVMMPDDRTHTFAFAMLDSCDRPRRQTIGTQPTGGEGTSATWREAPWTQV
jgi:hypothetical protein